VFKWEKLLLVWTWNECCRVMVDESRCIEVVVVTSCLAWAWTRVLVPVLLLGVVVQHVLWRSGI